MHGYSVVVVTWQSAPMLEALVATMNRHLGSAPELVVVDNLSGDDPERAARGYRGQVRFMPLERNHRLRGGLQHRGRDRQWLVRRDAQPGYRAGRREPRRARGLCPAAAGAGGSPASEPGRIRPAIGERDPGGAMALDRGDHSRPPAASAAARPDRAVASGTDDPRRMAHRGVRRRRCARLCSRWGRSTQRSSCTPRTWTSACAQRVRASPPTSARTSAG